jgi:hypothetical protein
MLLITPSTRDSGDDSTILAIGGGGGGVSCRGGG